MSCIVLQMPGRVIVPLFRSSFSSLLMPNNDNVRMKEVVAVRKRSHCNRNFFAMKIVFGIVRHFLTKLSQCECKMSTLKSCTYGLLQHLPIGNDLGQEKDTAFGSEFVVSHSPGFFHAAIRIMIGFLRRRLCSNQRLGMAIGLALHQKMDQGRVPIVSKAHVTINLKGLVFALLHFLNFVSSPTRTFRFFERHIHNSKSRIGLISRKFLGKCIIIRLLMTNSKAKIGRLF